MNIVYTVTKGKRDSGGCTCGKNHIKTLERMSEMNIYNDGSMFLNKRPTMTCLATLEEKIKTALNMMSPIFL